MPTDQPGKPSDQPGKASDQPGGASEQPPLRSHELIGARAYDRSGGYLGRVADLVLAPDGDGHWRIAEIVVTAGPWGRLLGYERDAETGPWPLVRLARWVLRRNTRRLPWTEVEVRHDDSHGARA